MPGRTRHMLCYAQDSLQTDTILSKQSLGEKTGRYLNLYESCNCSDHALVFSVSNKTELCLLVGFDQQPKRCLLGYNPYQHRQVRPGF